MELSDVKWKLDQYNEWFEELEKESDYEEEPDYEGDLEYEGRPCIATAWWKSTQIQPVHYSKMSLVI